MPTTFKYADRTAHIEREMYTRLNHRCWSHTTRHLALLRTQEFQARCKPQLWSIFEMKYALAMLNQRCSMGTSVGLTLKRQHLTRGTRHTQKLENYSTFINCMSSSRIRALLWARILLKPILRCILLRHECEHSDISGNVDTNELFCCLLPSYPNEEHLLTFRTYHVGSTVMKRALQSK